MSMSYENSWVLDPFAGVGSTIIASIKNNRNVIGIEKEELYCNITKQRIKDFNEGNLKIRPIDKPIHKSSGKDKVSQVPKEWLGLTFANDNGNDFK
jgi:adenine-specific DNA-methyltransferase